MAFGTSDAIEALVSNAKGLGKIFTGEEKRPPTCLGTDRHCHYLWRCLGLGKILGHHRTIVHGTCIYEYAPDTCTGWRTRGILIIESVFRVKLSDKVMERAQVVGMVILLSLLIFRNRE